MAFIGNSNTTQGFTPAIDYFNGNGSTTAFTLSRPVASVAQVQVVIENVPQNPGSAYTVSGNTITFTSAPPSGTSNIYVYYTSPITQVIAPGQGTVNTTALGNITNIASGNSSLTLQTGTTPTTAITINTSQNVGIGVTPSAWVSNFKALQVSTGGTFYGDYNNTTSYFGNNAYFNGTNWKYVNSSYALYAYQDRSAGKHVWAVAASGTAGNNITWSEAMTLDTSGNLKFDSGYGSAATAYGCRAWVNFNGTGTVAIRASGNVSSITDVNTGNYRVNFTNAMPDTNYSAVFVGGSAFNQYGDNFGFASTVSYVTMYCRNTNAVLADAEIINTAVFR
jgi:hypothetical protein